MEERQKELAEIKSYIEGVDKEVTMLLQSLQWDRKLLLEDPPMVSCRYDAGHRVPPDKRDVHERVCSLRSQGYSQDDTLLPEPFDPDASTLVKFSKEEITKIIDNASRHDPLFKKGAGRGRPGAEPLTVERLQAAYTADERRALHDAAVGAAPACHDLADLALISSTADAKSSHQKSRTEVLAELRDMRRRRTKYRVAPKTRNYSDVLRDVITTQMELYSGTQPTDTNKNTSKLPNNGGQNYSTKDTKSKHAENKDRPQNTDESSHSYGRRYDDFTEKNPSWEHHNGRGIHKSRYDKHDDRYGKQYTKEDRHYRDHDRHRRREKEKRSRSKDRSRKDDKYEKIVIKEEFDKRDRHSGYRESKRDKHSRSHKSYHDEGSSSSSSKSKRRHHDGYEDGECRHDSDRKRTRTECSNKHSESQQLQYKRYYDTVEIKQERDSS